MLKDYIVWIHIVMYITAYESLYVNKVKLFDMLLSKHFNWLKVSSLLCKQESIISKSSTDEGAAVFYTGDTFYSHLTEY